MEQLHHMVAMVIKLALLVSLLLPLADIEAALVTFCDSNADCLDATQYCDKAINVCAMCVHYAPCAYDVWPNDACALKCPEYTPAQPVTVLEDTTHAITTAIAIATSTEGTEYSTSSLLLGLLVVVIVIVLLFVLAIVIVAVCKCRQCRYQRDKKGVQEATKLAVEAKSDRDHSEYLMSEFKIVNSRQ